MKHNRYLICLMWSKFYFNETQFGEQPCYERSYDALIIYFLISTSVTRECTEISFVLFINSYRSCCWTCTAITAGNAANILCDSYIVVINLGFLCVCFNYICKVKYLNIIYISNIRPFVKIVFLGWVRLV